MPCFREIRHSACLIDFRRAVFRFVIHTDDFYGIFALHLAQRPKAGKQMLFFIVSDEGHRDKRFLALQSCEIAAHLFDNGLRGFRKRFFVYL